MRYLHAMVRVRNLEHSLNFYCHQHGIGVALVKFFNLFEITPQTPQSPQVFALPRVPRVHLYR